MSFGSRNVVKMNRKHTCFGFTYELAIMVKGEASLIHANPNLVFSLSN